jgi:hypothetical protein
MENRISTVLTDEVVSSILQKIDGIDTDMPFLFNLSTDDRKGGFKLGEKNVGFLEKGRDYITQHPDLLPAYASAEEVNKDATLTSQLTSIARKLRVLADKIDDTASVAGMEALAGVLAFYNSVKQAARNNVDGAQTIYDDLSERFPGRSKLTETE